MKRGPTSTTDSGGKEDKAATIFGLFIALAPMTAALVLVQVYVPTYPVGFILGLLLTLMLVAQVLTAITASQKERKWRRMGWKR